MNDEITQVFLEEAEDLLNDFEQALLALETDPSNVEVLNRIFRAAHTLKGNSSMLGMEEIASFTHTLEDVLDRLRKGDIKATRDTVNTLLMCRDVLNSMVERTRNAQPEASSEEVAARERAVAGLRAELANDPKATVKPPEKATAAATATAAAPQSGASAPAEHASTCEITLEPVAYRIWFAPDPESFKSGFDPIQFIRHLRTSSQIKTLRVDTDRLPSLEDLVPEQCCLAWTIELTARLSKGCFEEIFVEKGVHRFKIDRITAPSDGALEVRPTIAPVMSMTPPPGINVAAEAAAPAPAASAPPPSERARPAASAGAEPRSNSAAKNAENASIRVPVEKVDRLINLVGELVITHSIVAQAVDSLAEEASTHLRDAVSQMDRHARELRERIMSVRMVPIKMQFSKFQRLVRDLEGVTGKRVKLELIGEETELDKTVMERIGDPLTHLLRNAIDHGIESPSDRVASGKPEFGTVRLEAYQQSGAICVEVRDDGKGLDRERIVAKAVENGLIQAGQTISDDQVYGLIFKPGFSTAKQVTEISGRGVGMDVVKRNVESIGGTIAIRSERGHGTCFKITLPVSLAILDGQAVKVGDQTFILPLLAITESIQPVEGQLHNPPGSSEIVIVRDKPLPVMRLHQMFGIPDSCENATDGLLVLVESDGCRAAILVDELLAQQQVVLKNLETNFRKVSGVAGATILGDGKIALILDVPGLLAQSRGISVEAAPT